MKPTKRQLEFIKIMEEFVSEKFTGSTKEEASQYIKRNINEYRLKSISNWAIMRGYF
jgi:hypothetical protein